MEIPVFFKSQSLYLWAFLSGASSPEWKSCLLLPVLKFSLPLTHSIDALSPGSFDWKSLLLRVVWYKVLTDMGRWWSFLPPASHPEQRVFHWISAKRGATPACQSSCGARRKSYNENGCKQGGSLFQVNELPTSTS